jgi:hypothetical protein
MSAARDALHGVAGKFFAHGNVPDLLRSIRLQFLHFTKEMRKNAVVRQALAPVNPSARP